MVKMDLKTKAGIKVVVNNEGENKILSFDQPVRVIELSQNESKKIGSSLIKNG